MPVVEHIAAEDVNVGDLIGGSRVIGVQKYLTAFVGFTYEFTFADAAPHTVLAGTELEVIRGIDSIR